MKIFLLPLFFVQTTFSAYIPIKEKVPLKLHHIMTILQTNELYSVHKQEINSLIPQIDQAFSSLDDSDIRMIIKSEIFKTLLQFPPSSQRSFRSLSTTKLNDLYSLSKKLRSPFFAWLASSVHADLKSLLHSPLFPSFKKKINSPHNRWSPTMALMKKKFSLLLPWHHYLTTTPENQLEEKVYPLILKCLRQIHFKSSLHASWVPLRPPSHNQLQYFEKISPQREKNPIDSLLNPIIEQSKKVDLPEPVDDWTPKKDDYSQKLPQPTDDWLPEPVNDWIL